jgi:hypothetical protein
MANGPVSGQQTATGMQQMAADQTAFAQQLAQAQKMGLNATSLSQIAQGGAQSGLPVLEGLTGPGGAGSVSAINAAEKQIMKAAAKTGDIGGPAVYQAGQQAGAMIASGLKSQLGAVEAAIGAIAKGIVATLDKDLGIHPASTSHGGGHGTVVHHHTTVHVTVQGSVVSNQDLSDHIQTVLLDHGSRNWQAGIIVPGKAH